MSKSIFLLVLMCCLCEKSLVYSTQNIELKYDIRVEPNTWRLQIMMKFIESTIKQLQEFSYEVASVELLKNIVDGVTHDVILRKEINLYEDTGLHNRFRFQLTYPQFNTTFTQILVNAADIMYYKIAYGDSGPGNPPDKSIEKYQRVWSRVYKQLELMIQGLEKRVFTYNDAEAIVALFSCIRDIFRNIYLVTDSPVFVDKNVEFLLESVSSRLFNKAFELKVIGSVQQFQWEIIDIFYTLSSISYMRCYIDHYMQNDIEKYLHQISKLFSDVDRNDHETIKMTLVMAKQVMKNLVTIAPPTCFQLTSDLATVKQKVSYDQELLHLVDDMLDLCFEKILIEPDIDVSLNQIDALLVKITAEANITRTTDYNQLLHEIVKVYPEPEDSMYGAEELIVSLINYLQIKMTPSDQIDQQILYDIYEVFNKAALSISRPNIYIDPTTVEVCYPTIPKITITQENTNDLLQLVDLLNSYLTKSKRIRYEINTLIVKIVQVINLQEPQTTVSIPSTTEEATTYQSSTTLFTFTPTATDMTFPEFSTFKSTPPFSTFKSTPPFSTFKSIPPFWTTRTFSTISPKFLSTTPSSRNFSVNTEFTFSPQSTDTTTSDNVPKPSISPEDPIWGSIIIEVEVVIDRHRSPTTTKEVRAIIEIIFVKLIQIRINIIQGLIDPNVIGRQVIDILKLFKAEPGINLFMVHVMEKLAAVAQCISRTVNPKSFTCVAGSGSVHAERITLKFGISKHSKYLQTSIDEYLLACLKMQLALVYSRFEENHAYKGIGYTDVRNQSLKGSPESYMSSTNNKFKNMDISENDNTHNKAIFVSYMNDEQIPSNWKEIVMQIADYVDDPTTELKSKNDIIDHVMFILTDLITSVGNYTGINTTLITTLLLLNSQDGINLIKPNILQSIGSLLDCLKQHQSKVRDIQCRSTDLEEGLVYKIEPLGVVDFQRSGVELLLSLLKLELECIFLRDVNFEQIKHVFGELRPHLL